MFLYHENVSGDGSFLQQGDFYAVDESYKIAVVSDSPIRELTRSNLRKYPQDDNGLKAGEAFCNTMLDRLVAFVQDGTISAETFNSALVDANKSIKVLNQSLHKTSKGYLTYDCAETVGMAAVQVGDSLIYGGLEDCYVFVLRGPNLENVEKVDHQIMKARRFLDKLFAAGEYQKEYPEELKLSLKPEAFWEPIWCNVLRNNNDIHDENGNRVGWGCFTGEEKAESFFQVHQIQLEPQDHIFVLSDGMIPILNHKDFLEWFIGNWQSTFEFQKKMREKVVSIWGDNNTITNKEKTLIYWKNSI